MSAVFGALAQKRLHVLSAARKVNQEDVHQDETSMPGASTHGKYPVNNYELTEKLLHRRNPFNDAPFPKGEALFSDSMIFFFGTAIII